MIHLSSLIPKTMLGQILSGFSLVLAVFTFGLPVILATGHSTVVSAENAAEFGIREFIMKPYTLQKFSDAIHRILSTG